MKGDGSILMWKDTLPIEKWMHLVPSWIVEGFDNRRTLQSNFCTRNDETKYLKMIDYHQVMDYDKIDEALLLRFSIERT